MMSPDNLNPVDLLHTHVTGVLSHGHGSFHAYVDIGEYPHDPNLTINIILKELLRQAKESNNFLPPILYIQADNCWRENKNRYVFSFLQLLVSERIFNEVHMSFLIVGHTHEDIDARFSMISRTLGSKDAEIFEDLLKILQSAERVTKIFDVQIKSRHAAEEGLGPRISKKQKVDKNAGRHGQGKKKTSYSRRRHAGVTVQKTIVVLVHDGSKKHIWLKIWMDMFNCFVNMIAFVLYVFLSA
ncbi:uncharacterized protein LOC127835717 [Dreissena polymorpha]|uniref:uncharacterized protein LOC127835717 n=1 Tax=Dreissena polymorpha TaxID=45954 RepID=UPI0022652A09|nr:uncharacterized protein LOC127835717 [Dreissena polymorpha]